ncbi:hypothetical protein LX36DRAFT_653896 [Colletotrichum falcatum]|nr:hypothetical protein LX36DRAFT_653896 [Colletotrichum falcatum]
MAPTPNNNDNNPFYEYLVDDTEQVMASTAMSPHFPPDVFGGAFDFGDRPHHATRPGNQPTQSGPGHDRPNNAFDESTTATPANQGQTVASVQSRQVIDAQHQLQQPRLHFPALGLGPTHADYAHQHQSGSGATTSLADQQQPDAWLPREYGIPVYHGGQQHQQQHGDATASGPPTSATASGTNAAATIPAAGGLGGGNSSSDDSIGTGGHLYDFGFAAQPPGEPLFLGEEYADVTPLSTAAAVAAVAAAAAAHPQLPTTTFDFHPSPWLPRLQDSSSVTLTPNVAAAAAAAAELNHDVQRQGKVSMETDNGVKDPLWGEEEMAAPEARGGAAGAHKAHKAPPRPRRQERKGKRRAADNNEDDEKDDDGGPASPAGRASVSGRSIKSASSAPSAGGSSGKAGAPTPPRLRSASRTSKNHSHKQTETPEERRTRASHNLVEKQYRNRLNAQFEGLLHALPEQVRGAAGGGDGDESDQERRVSKAEVLDMARRHIKSLEQEREALRRERGELLRSLESLERGAAVGEEGGGDGRTAEFLGVEGSALDERVASSWRSA